MEELTIPTRLAESAQGDADNGRRQWLAELPRNVGRLAQRWSLALEEPFQPGGQTAWVAPARTALGEDLVLKVGWRHPEGEHEADGLAQWSGAGAVRLHAVHEEADSCALLLERCRPGDELGRVEPEPRQDEVVADLLHELWQAPMDGHPFRSLQAMCDDWADEYEERPNADLDPGLARAGVALFRSLPADAQEHTLLVTDLHAANVLAAERRPWLVIDPKPHVGDPCYDPLQHMLNCGERLRADPAELADRMARLCAVDAGRLRLWLFARCVVESPWWPGLTEVAARLAPA